MGAEAHINACYKHFYYFVNHFKLVDKKELEPLVSLIFLCSLFLLKGHHMNKFVLLNTKTIFFNSFIIYFSSLM